MAERADVAVRMFGLLRAARRTAGLPYAATVTVPPEGISAASIADDLELPRELIEGVFCNHTVYGLDHIVMPGDEIAFVPYGTPGPHRIYLGLRDAGNDTA